MVSERLATISSVMVTTMEFLPGLPQPQFPSVPVRPEPIGLLLSRDLIFTSKVTGTAADLGYSMITASVDSQARSMIKTYQPRIVLIDLSAGRLVLPAALITYQEIAGSDTWFVAFGSHVDVEVLDAAKAAGCHDVLPRSRFAADLPKLLRHYFSHSAVRNG
jgi:hypothetical protein